MSVKCLSLHSVLLLVACQHNCRLHFGAIGIGKMVRKDRMRVVWKVALEYCLGNLVLILLRHSLSLLPLMTKMMIMTLLSYLDSRKLQQQQQLLLSLQCRQPTLKLCNVWLGVDLLGRPLLSCRQY